MNEAVTTYRLLPTAQAQRIRYSNNQYNSCIFLIYCKFKKFYACLTFPVNVFRDCTLKVLKLLQSISGWSFADSSSVTHTRTHTNILNQTTGK
jgi:hypothetical protein